jgi:hypothetical protein
VDLFLLFLALDRLGFLETFLGMTWLLFTDAATRINLNGKSTKAFSIAQGVHQGYSLAPYLFLVVGKILNHVIKQEVQISCI